MLFDDRLDTVLRSSANGEAAGRTQYRQLLDLLGRKSGSAEDNPSELTLQAYGRLDELSEVIRAEERANILHEPWLKIRNPQLVEWFAGRDARVATAALTTAQLSESEWEQLIPRLDVTSRGLLRHRRDLPDGAVDMLARLGVGDLVLPMPEAIEGTATEVVSQPEAPSLETTEAMILAGGAGAAAVAGAIVASDADGASAEEPAQDTLPKSESEQAISALRKRIEDYQLAKKQGSKQQRPHGDPRLPLGDEPEAVPLISIFHFASDASGLVTWAEPRVAPLLVGAKITNPSRWSIFEPTPRLIATMAERRPLLAGALTIGGAQDIAGEWLVDATPMFAQQNGAFEGYSGRIYRQTSAPAAANDGANSEADSAAEQMRQLLHELRTPVNAIQGFAEIIQQQIFGRVPNAYRALAAAIALDAANLLGGFDEIDRLAKLESGGIELEEGSSDWREAAALTVQRLNTVLAPREAGFDLKVSGSSFIVPLEQDEALTLAWRILASIAGVMAPGERLALTLSGHAGQNGDDTNGTTLTIPLPAAFGQDSDAFSTGGPKQASTISSGMFGTGFTLRLARQEARAAGGALEQGDGQIMVNLPTLTGKHSGHTAETATKTGAGPA